MFILDVTCGSSGLVMNEIIPNLTSTLVNLIKIGVPLLLIFFGMLDLGKAVMAQKEDEIKKGQQTFIKRLIAAAIVFLVVFIVQIVINLLVPKNSDATSQTNNTILNCIDCFINGSGSCETVD